MEKYIDKVTNLKNKSLLLGKAILDKSICQLVFNAYEEVMKVVQTLNNLDTIFTFDQLIAKLLAENVRQKQQTLRLGNEKAFIIDFNQATTL